MKKLSAIILTFILLMSMVMPSAMAEAETLSKENITVNINGYDIEVTVKATVGGRMTAHLYNQSRNTTLGVDYQTPTVSNGVYTYSFIFELDSTVTTSTLHLQVGNNVSAPEIDINYASIWDKNAFYNELHAIENPDHISGYLATKTALTNADIASYIGLSSEKVQKLVSAVIEDLDLHTDYPNLEVEDETYIANKVADVARVESEFNVAFAQAMKYAEILDADASEWESVATTAMTEGLFDDEFYTANGSVAAFLGISQVYDYLADEVAVMTVLTEDQVKKAFDRATLAAIKGELEYGAIKTAFLYFEDNNRITVSDMTDIDDLVAAEKDVDLWKSAKEGTYEDCAALIAGIVQIAGEMVENGALSGSTGGNNTTGDNVTRPVSPGGFTGGGLGGGGASAPTTPVDPEPDTPVVPSGTFSDIASVEWAKESIEALAEMGVLNGKGDGKFAPNDSVTREEFIKIIVAAFELSDDEAACDFNDVAKDSWSYPYIAAANKLGIVSGDGANFNPGAGISRQDMAVIIHRVFEHLGLEVSGDAINFDDGADIAGYAKDAVETLTAAGIINGMGDGTFAPAGTVTRAQAAKVVFGLINLVGGGK